MSIWTDGLPAWWAMAVAVAALLAGVLLGELHGRGVGRGQVREDRAAERAVRQVRSWRDGRGERTAFLMPDGTWRPPEQAGWLYRSNKGDVPVSLPPEVAHEDRPRLSLPCLEEDHGTCEAVPGCDCPCHPALVAHEDRHVPEWERDQSAADAWLAHTDLAIDLANDDPTVSAWTQQMAESMDAFLAGLLAEHPVPYLPGEEER
jgi:hypothetical protein